MTMELGLSLTAGNGAVGTGINAWTPQSIKEAVDQHHDDTAPLRTRMEEDYLERYRITEHVNYDPKTGEVLEGYAVYTSNAGRTFGDKIISWLTGAELLLRAPHLEAAEHQEEQDNLKERFAIGCLASADERLTRLLQPNLRGQEAFFTTVRGGYVGGRCLLVKRPDNTTYVDITPWDPLHIYWEVGADGLEWVCYRIKKTRAQIRREYGVMVSGSHAPAGTNGSRGSSDAEKEGIYTYDFYDRVMNTEVTDGEVLKPPTPHGSPRVPAYLVLVGPMPMLQSDTATEIIADVGESIYVALRNIYKKYNDIMSIMLELVARARRQTVIMESRDGKKTLPQDPWVAGTDIATVTGDKIYTLEAQRLAQETGAYMGLVSQEMQHASLPHSAYGELQFQLSGYAINTLRQGIETVLSSRIEALTQIYLQIANLLYDQFKTGAFEGIRLSGVDSGRKYFNQNITPQMLEGTCDYTVKLMSQLPQDDMTKWSMAQIAKEYLSTEDILDDIIGMQDSQQAVDKLNAERASQGLPEAVLFTLGTAADNRGEEFLAKLYLTAYKMLMAQKLGILPPENGSTPPEKGGGPPGNKGQRPEVQPEAARGSTPAPETSNNGPGMVAPKTPRNRRPAGSPPQL